MLRRTSMLSAIALLLALAPAAAQGLSPRNANYTIDVRLDARSRTLTARETLVWTNISNAPQAELQFHLYYNAWRNADSTWMREHTLTTWWGQVSARRSEDFAAIDVSSIRLTGSGAAVDLTNDVRFIAPDDGNTDDRTVMAVTLPAPVGAGQTVTLDIAWTAKIPRPFARTGAIGNYFFIAQWFPKIGVLDAAGRWNCHQFHVGTEFFSDYGVYDVRMTVPRGWPLAATGRERERIDNADGTTTHRYYQEDVHDFAWTTSPDFIERRDRFEQTGLPPVEMRLMLQPEHASQAARHFEGTRAALRLYGEWFGPYPYGHVTIVDPVWQSETDGMEYPTLFTAGTWWRMPREDTYLEDTLIHEAGHQWWYGLVGTNEFEDAWMDEGINQYANARAMAEAFPEGRVVLRFFGGFVPWVIDDAPWDRVLFGDILAGYRRGATTDVPSTPSFKYWPGTSTPNTYAKPSLWLHTLERALGWTTVQQILATFFERWKFKHPRPDDLFQIANEISRRDLTPFFDQVYRGSAVFDYGVESVSSAEAADETFLSTVVVRRHGDGVFPVTILVTLANGEQRRFAWDGSGRWHRVTVEHTSRAVSAQIDPDQTLLLDTNFTNNSFTTEPQSGRAATKWAAAWMVWLQDQLLTWTFFV
ncbi:MAG TPA: M1 family metallopeptidase [Vicinamibacterales bacterium]|nr:M1 family metallopeptidase [Vicinamibacterales bacterium]